MGSVHNPAIIAHSPYVNSRLPASNRLTLSIQRVAYEGQVMSDQLPPMQADDLHAAGALPASHMPAAARLHKRKSNLSVSPISAPPQLVHRPSSKRKKYIEGTSSTSAPISDLATQYSGRILGRQDTAPTRPQRLSDASAFLWNHQTNPPPGLEPPVPDVLPHTDLCYCLSCPCYICGVLASSHQLAEIPQHIMNQIDPSFTPLRSLEQRVHKGVLGVPPEIIHQVCEYLDEGDLGNFRRTSKRHAMIGDEHMFRQGTLRIHLHPDHFDRLQAIAMSPMTCQRIRTFELVGGQHGFFTMLFPSVYRVDPGEDQRLYSKLQLQSCIQHLTNLEAFEMRINTQQDRFLTPDTHFRLSEQMHFLLYDVQSVPSMNIRYLKMECVGWQSPCCVGSRLSKDAFNLKVLEDAAGRLLRLDLTVQPHPQHPEMTQCHPLAHYLQFATNLEELKLSFGKRGLPRLVDLGEVCRLTWSHLRSVDFNYAKVSQQDLLTFFEAHSDLKEVRLGSMVLREGRWTTAIERMSRVLPKLEMINFSGILHDTRLFETRTFLCGDSLTHWAHQAVVQKQRGPPIVYPPDPLTVAQALLRRDRGLQQQRRAAGLSCDLCKTCGQLKHH